MQDAREVSSLGQLGLLTQLLPPVSMLTCVITSLYYNYDEATYTHCEVPELLPSLSSVIGGFELQKFIWTFRWKTYFLLKLLLTRVVNKFLKKKESGQNTLGWEPVIILINEVLKP